MRRRQPAPAPQPEIDEYAEVRIPFDEVLRKLVNTPHVARTKAQAKKPAPKKG
jgi:hypothetical protein